LAVPPPLKGGKMKKVISASPSRGEAIGGGISPIKKESSPFLKNY